MTSPTAVASTCVGRRVYATGSTWAVLSEVLWWLNGYTPQPVLVSCGIDQLPSTHWQVHLVRCDRATRRRLFAWFSLQRLVRVKRSSATSAILFAAALQLKHLLSVCVCVWVCALREMLEQKGNLVSSRAFFFDRRLSASVLVSCRDLLWRFAAFSSS